MNLRIWNAMIMLKIKKIQPVKLWILEKQNNIKRQCLFLTEFFKLFFDYKLLFF